MKQLSTCCILKIKVLCIELFLCFFVQGSSKIELPLLKFQYNYICSNLVGTDETRLKLLQTAIDVTVSSVGRIQLCRLMHVFNEQRHEYAVFRLFVEIKVAVAVWLSSNKSMYTPSTPVTFPKTINGRRFLKQKRDYSGDSRQFISPCLWRYRLILCPLADHRAKL